MQFLTTEHWLRREHNDALSMPMPKNKNHE